MANEMAKEEIDWDERGYNVIDERDLKEGDHIYCQRKIGFYTHHGIYIGEPDCEVIHFSGPDGATSGELKQEDQEKAEELEKQYNNLHVTNSEKADKIIPELDKLVDLQEGYSSSNERRSIRSTTLANFLKSSKLCYVRYNYKPRKRANKPFCRASYHKIKAMPRKKTANLAKHICSNPKKLWKKYNLVRNNCETFACFCKTGRMDIATQLHPYRILAKGRRKKSCKNETEALAALKEYYKKSTK